MVGSRLARVHGERRSYQIVSKIAINQHEVSPAANKGDIINTDVRRAYINIRGDEREIIIFVEELRR